MFLALVAVLAAVVAAQLAALGGMGERRPVGDEGTYLARGASQDPYAPRSFLRPPLLPWLAHLCHRSAGGPATAESRLRLLMATASCLTVALTATAGWRLGGPAVALVAALLLAVQPERILLGCHLWPDTPLALLLAATCVLATLPATPAAAFAAAGVSTLGVLCRIDFLAALPLLPAAWWWSHGPPGVAAAVLVVPPLLALALLSLRNRRRYGIPLPDTTWAFNLMVARSQAGDGDGQAIESAVLDVLAGWQELTPAQRLRRGLAALRHLLRSPWFAACGVGRRLLVLVGPDTFVREKLLPRAAAYPQLGDRSRRLWDAALRISFPLLVTIVVIASLTALRLPGSFAWPSFGVALAAVSFHTRTRYRLALMPALCLMAAEAIAGPHPLVAGRPAAAAATVAAGGLLWAVLLRVRGASELPPG